MRLIVLGCLALLLSSLVHAQTVQFPSPPPGLVSEPPSARDTAALAELQLVDAQLQELVQRRSKLGLGWPITMMSFGLMTMVVGGLAAAEAGASSSSDDNTAAHVFGYFAVPAAILTVGGALFLGLRIRQRRASAPEIHELKWRKKRLELQLMYGPPPTAGSPGHLLLAGRF